ncbi:MAG TPA: UDP-3-O-(3-hydroxymyristoyl)glucosamine N-acyltransferase [Legionella sp.]|nr:UDP-3-O-(3-hydroxymyristoyl)glucosamine N-acyltransferase [Legionella sp.]
MLTLAQLAKALDGVWCGNPDHPISSLSSLSRAKSSDLTYLAHPLMLPLLKSSLAGAVLLKEEHQGLYQGNCILVAEPLEAMNKAVSLLLVDEVHHSGIHATAQIHPLAQLGKNVSVGAHTIIHEQVVLSDGCVIGSNNVIEGFVTIGPDSQIGSGTMIHEGSQIGAHVIISPGCVIGSSPFNYSKVHGNWQRGPAIGGTIIGRGVHIGANTVIDRGSLGDTYLANGVCIDNLVQIAHDVIIGENTAVAGCAAIGAYTQIGSDCIIGGASCIAAYVRLTDDVVISGMSTVSRSVNKPGIYSSGTLIHEHNRWRRNAARFRRLDDYIVKLGVLERKINNASD